MKRKVKAISLPFKPFVGFKLVCCEKDPSDSYIFREVETNLNTLSDELSFFYNFNKKYCAIQ